MGFAIRQTQPSCKFHSQDQSYQCQGQVAKSSSKAFAFKTKVTFHNMPRNKRIKQLFCCHKINMHLPETALDIFMTMHYELKGKHEVCFKAKIGLTGSIVNSNAKKLNSKAWATESKKFSTPLPSPMTWGVRSLLCTPHFALHSTYWSSELNWGPVAGQGNMHSTYRIWCF